MGFGLEKGDVEKDEETQVHNAHPWAELGQAPQADRKIDKSGRFLAVTLKS
jgi:hypothetical protein